MEYITLLRHFVSVICGSTTEKLGNHISKEGHHVDLRIQELRKGDSRVDVSTANCANQIDHNSKCATNNQWVTMTGEDGQNKEKSANVLCEVGSKRVTHGSTF